MNIIALLGDEGHLNNSDSVKLLNMLEKHSNQPVEIHIKKLNDIRSSKQNRYLHGGVLEHLAIALNESGNETEAMGVKIPWTKEFVKIFFKIAFNESKDTSKSTVEELSKAIGKCRDHSSANLGYYIPSADEWETYGE